MKITYVSFKFPPAGDEIDECYDSDIFQGQVKVSNNLLPLTLPHPLNLFLPFSAPHKDFSVCLAWIVSTYC